MDLGDVGPPGVSSLAMAWQSETEWRFSERWETRIKLNGGAEKLPCLMTGGCLFLGFSSTIEHEDLHPRFRVEHRCRFGKVCMNHVRENHPTYSKI